MLFLEILKFIIVLSFLVIIHELGHFLFAKLFGVHVEEFGVGYPPRAKTLFRFKNTIFSLNWIPFGGFVKLEGEDGEEMAKKNHSPSPTPARPTSIGVPFYKKSVPTRLLIILVGAAVNFLFGVFAFSLYFSVKGIPELAPNPRIAEVMINSPAATSKVPANVDIKGLQIGKEFVAINNVDDAVNIINEHLGEHVTLVTTGNCVEVQCDQHEQKFDVYLRKKSETPADQGSMGIRFEPVVVQKFYPWPEMPVRGAVYGTKQAFYLIYFILNGLKQIAHTAAQGQVPKEVAGPVGIFTQASKAGFFSHGFLELVNFAGILSVNLAVMNVLPIPALDGGRALFILLELLVGKKNIQKVEGYANYGGFALLIGLIILVTMKDIGNLLHP